MRYELCVISNRWEKMLESFVVGAGRKVGSVELWVLRRFCIVSGWDGSLFSHICPHTMLCFALVGRKVLHTCALCVAWSWLYGLYNMWAWCSERQGDCELHPERYWLCTEPRMGILLHQLGPWVLGAQVWESPSVPPTVGKGMSMGVCVSSS